MSRPFSVAVIGAGPAGLMAAEVLSAGGAQVTVLDRMPSVGRKLLMAGRGGLNLTHSEPFERFMTRYGAAAERLRPVLEAFTPADLIAWANGLGQETFVGSSGRVFPKAMKASPLLRAWLGRLERQGVRFRLRSDWRGWDDDGALRFADETVLADATVLALGGASWPRLGGDGGWVRLLREKGVAVSDLKPANAGFDVAWSAPFRERFAGQPLKNIALRFGSQVVRGEAMVTAYGLEGGVVYAASAALRDALPAVAEIDLRPDRSVEQLAAALARPRGKESLSNFLRKAAKLSPLEINLLREPGPPPADPAGLAERIKSVPLTLTAMQPLARAISTAGGVSFDAVDDGLMLKAVPGTYVVGEMLDWEAPTGGYLLQACFATGAFAARAVLSRRD
ncbi:MAG: TIGR03862 family flavoprotein [Proteobacteria bacterium]|nr:TIGR03862 family flavoprotein [Pseudomonadota bacterium]